MDNQNNFLCYDNMTGAYRLINNTNQNDFVSLNTIINNGMGNSYVLMSNPSVPNIVSLPVYQNISYGNFVNPNVTYTPFQNYNHNFAYVYAPDNVDQPNEGQTNNSFTILDYAANNNNSINNAIISENDQYENDEYSPHDNSIIGQMTIENNTNSSPTILNYSLNEITNSTTNRDEVHEIRFTLKDDELTLNELNIEEPMTSELSNVDNVALTQPDGEMISLIEYNESDTENNE